MHLVWALLSARVGQPGCTGLHALSHILAPSDVVRPVSSRNQLMAQAGRGREGMTWRFVCIGWVGLHDRFVMHMTKPRIRGLFLANSRGHDPHSNCDH